MFYIEQKKANSGINPFERYLKRSLSTFQDLLLVSSIIKKGQKLDLNVICFKASTRPKKADLQQVVSAGRHRLKGPSAFHVFHLSLATPANAPLHSFDVNSWQSFANEAAISIHTDLGPQDSTKGNHFDEASQFLLIKQRKLTSLFENISPDEKVKISSVHLF